MDELDAAIELIASLATDRIGELDDAELVEFARKSEQAAHLIQALQVSVADQVRQRSDPSLGERRLDHRLGATGAASAMIELTGATRHDLNKRLRAASLLLSRQSVGQTLPPLHPVVSQALFDARIGLDTSMSIVTHLETIADRVDADDLADAETALVGYATERGADIIPAIAARIRDLLDPDGPEPRDRERRRRRFLRLVLQADGMLKISGLADPENAALLLDAVGAVERTGPVFRTSDEITADAERDDRTQGQKLLDRLIEVATAGADAPTSSRAGRRGSQRIRPVLVATLDDFDSGEGVARFLGTNQVVPVERLKEIAKNSGAKGVETALFGEKGRLLALGRRQRSNSETQRFGIVLRDGDTCSRNGCSRPAAECDAHHIREWANGGETDIDNAVLLCQYHHWLLHQGGGTLVASGGRAYYRPPKQLDSRWQLLGDPPPPRRRRREYHPAA